MNGHNNIKWMINGRLQKMDDCIKKMEDDDNKK